LRPARFEHPLHLSIDPVDSRFLDRSSLAPERIHVVQDASMVGLSIEDGPLEEQLVGGTKTLSTDDVGLWLWGYWGRLRGQLFRSPLRFGDATADEWRDAQRSGSAAIEAIVARAAALEEARLSKLSWRL